MTQTGQRCYICGGFDVTRTTDYLDGGTLLESDESCAACGYASEFAYGATRETIGRWYAEWGSAADNKDESVARDDARWVATLIRRYELGLIPPAEAGFVAALAADPADVVTAGVYADWLDEQPPTKERELSAIRLRRYYDASGFDTLPGAVAKFGRAVKPLAGLLGGPT